MRRLCGHVFVSTFQGISVYTHTHINTQSHELRGAPSAAAPFCGYCDLSAGGHIYCLYCLADVLVLALVLVLILLVLLHIILEQRVINAHSKSNLKCSLRACIKYQFNYR